MNIVKLFHKACVDYGLIADGDHILVGLSGGKDSMALVELLGRRAQIYKPRFRVTALHVRVKERDYHSDVSYLEHFCAAVKVPFLVRDVAIERGAESGNERLSEANPCFLCSWYRRKALFDTAQELGCNKIALGHHRDDLLETMLMNLIYQGAFATMPPKLKMDKMPLEIIRPLCLIEEAELIAYAAEQGYEKQTVLCPFEHVSSREKVKGLLAQIKAMNPEAADTMFAAMSNVKADYLPSKV